MHSVIFLIGMPATGKTYWGTRLAARYDMRFIDLDELIAAEVQLTVPEIFARYGEAGFRDYEHRCLNGLLAGSPRNVIIACGGGTPCYHDNLRIMLEAGTVIYLHTELHILHHRISSSGQSRPMFDTAQPIADTLAALYGERKMVYERAHHILHTDNISVTTFDKILGNE
jgi:shikimate kinase